MESRPQNPEFRINPENFHPCITEIDCVEYFHNWTRDFQDMYYKQTQKFVNGHSNALAKATQHLIG